MNIAIIGRSQMLYKTAIQLNEAGHSIKAIITASAAPEYTAKEDDFKELASKLKVPFFLTSHLDEPEIKKTLRNIDLGVSFNWISLIREEHIQLFKLGILNAHAGQIPAYRGNATPNWALLQNEKSISLSIYFMQGDVLDCGSVITELPCELTPSTTITEVYDWIEKITPEAYMQAVSLLADNPDFQLRNAQEEDDGASRCYPRLPEDGLIYWNAPPEAIHNLIRATTKPFAGAYSYHEYEGKLRKLIILESRVVEEKTQDLAICGQVLKNDASSGESWVQCGEGVLALVRCQYDDEKNEFLPGQRWKSIRMRVNMNIQDWLWRVVNQ